tara:strand:+ start:398 stop:766 length:369 start_codon:yes stop_codon:yes gene_type:complete
MISPYLKPKIAEKEYLEQRYKVRAWITGGLDKMTLAMEQQTHGFEIMSNLVRYCHIYSYRCTEPDTHSMPLVQGFVEKMEERYPIGTTGRVRLIEQMLLAAYYLLDPEIDEITEAGKNLGKT